MSLEEDMQLIGEQERLLVFTQFGDAEAWALGCRLRELAQQRPQPVLIEIEAAGRMLFCSAVGQTTPGNADWVRRKRNVVMCFGRSSYGVGRWLDSMNATLEEKQGLPLTDYAAHGGGFPIKLPGIGTIGTVVVSGLPQRDDHALAVQALAEVIGVSGQVPYLP